MDLNYLILHVDYINMSCSFQGEMTMSLLDQQIHILIIEDDEVDIKAIKQEFRNINNSIYFRTASDGVEALNKLYGENAEVKLDPPPTLIILDTKMPKMDGIEFLKALRMDPQFDNILVYMLSGLYSTQDKLATRDLKVAGHIVKPLGHNEALHIYMSVLKLPGFSK